MKVLFMQKMAGISGSELYLLKLLPLLKKRGIDCEFISVSLPEDVVAAQKFKNLLQEAGFKVHELVTKGVFSKNLIDRIFRIYKEGNFDVFHSHLIHADFWAASVKLLFDRKIKLVSTKHGYDESYQAKFGYNPTIKRFDAYFLISYFAEKLINRSAAVSEGLRRFFVGKGISPASKIETIVHGLDFEKEYVAEAPENCRYFAKQLVIVGRLIPYKGQELVIKCLPDILKAHPEAGLVLVGKGDSENDLKELVQTLKLEKNVQFEGYRTNVHSYLHQSDIAIVSSRSEGFGIVILEAWFHSKPVVAFDVPAPNTIIDHQKNGLLIKPFDLQELTSTLIHLLDHPEEQKRLGNAGKQSLASTYSEERMISATINLYNKVLDRK